MNVEIVDHTTYDLSVEYYVLHQEAGISEVEGPFTERQAYEFAKRCLQNWTILRFHDKKET